MDKNRIQGVSVGRAGNLPRSPYPSKMQQNIQGELNFSATPAGEAREAGREETESRLTTHAPERPAGTSRLREEICDRENLKKALRRVKAKRGRRGITG